MGLKPPSFSTRSLAQTTDNRAPIVIDSTAPSAPPEEKEGKYIGVPDDYRSPGPTSSVGQPVPDRLDPMANRAPRYERGAELTPGRFGPNGITELQTAMAAAGLIGPDTKFRLGVWDEPSRAAYRNLLEYANMRGLTWEQALNEMASNPATSMNDMLGVSGRQPLVKRLTNPADLRTALKSTLQAVAGEAPPEMIERMIQAYHGQEGAAQEQAYAMADASGGTITDPPSPDAFAEDWARREMPVETGAVDMLEQLNAASEWLFG